MRYSKKEAKRVYKLQSEFFGFTPKSLDNMSARDIYKECEKDYKNQPRKLQKRFLRYLQGELD